MAERISARNARVPWLTFSARWFPPGAGGQYADVPGNEVSEMPGAIKKSFGSPDERRAPDKTLVEVVDLETVKAARLTLQPGWRWSECVKPVAGTESCQQRHVGAVIAGHLYLSHVDGTEADLGPGEAYVIEAGHDAWVVGDEPFIALEFETSTAEHYAKAGG